MSGPPALAAALRCRREGHALPREFHLDESIYEYELDAIWRRSWLLAGCSAQAAEPGEFFRFDVAAYSVVVVRDEAGTLHALHNTCRHRGMPVCLEPAGVVKRWVCPYHRWSYGLDGRLLGCDGIEDVIDVDEYGLHRIAVAEVGRLVFVWLSGSASRFEDAGRELGAALCTAGARAGEGCPPDRLRRPCELEAGLAGLYRLPREDRWWAAKRTPLAPGFVTESLDGAGDTAHGRLSRLRRRHSARPYGPELLDARQRRPRGGDTADARRPSSHDDPGAVAGRAAMPSRAAITNFGRLVPFWRLTSEQDWSLCERNHSGVCNPAFTPGPYSPEREYNVAAFDAWYLRRLTG